MGSLAETDLQVTLGTLSLKSPLIIVSGVFGYGEEFNRLAGFQPQEAGAVVLKGVTRNPWAGNKPPRIVETMAGMLNSIGLQNIGIERLVNEKLPLWEGVDTHVIINVAGHSVHEYREVSQIAATSPQVSALELNLSCPNVEKGGLAFGTDPELVKRITADVTAAVPHVPVWVKLSPNVEKIEDIARAAAEGGAAAVSLINTLRGMAVDIDTARPILSRNAGGLSGPAIKPVALLKVAEVYRAFTQAGISIPIVGIGGLVNGGDVLEFMIAGATAVGIGTVLFYDPLSLSRINGELRELLSERSSRFNDPRRLKIKNEIGTLQWN